ncbi:hypothetical protein NJQ99_03645 [Hyphomicrobiales bacterium FT118]|uniref:Uncharacterized protein n=1 Tax=Futiania mangrovi TaxID=2959716 RepID=A0A9J6PFV3_9PROT|nr:hypothetical protein [Futiania mangrovii]MCP1335495.1 hypothetical protein [Futiania mangrovii]
MARKPQEGAGAHGLARCHEAGDGGVERCGQAGPGQHPCQRGAVGARPFRLAAVMMGKGVQDGAPQGFGMAARQACVPVRPGGDHGHARAHRLCLGRIQVPGGVERTQRHTARHPFQQ